MNDVSSPTQGSNTNVPPAQSEIPIDQNPQSSPTPISNTPPERAAGRREAIQQAFDRANNPPVKDAKKPAEPTKAPPKAREAKAGDNNPPEPTEKLNLTKRPSEQGEIPRGERGQFAPRPQAAAQAATDAQTQAAGRPNAAPQQAPGKQLPSNAPFRDPLPRMSEQAKASWADTPEHVRADVHRVHQEFVQAYQTHKADVDAMTEIRHFQQMAAQHGTTLKAALTNYVGMENKLRSDPIGGLEQLVHNLNLKADNGGRVTLRDIAHHVMTRTPEQLRQMQQGNIQQGQQQGMAQLHQEVTGLRQELQQMHTERQFTQLRGGVDMFADDGNHPRFDELGDIIHEEVARGYSLEDAYRRAELLRPYTQAAQSRAQPAQSRGTDRSISGAPAASGSSPKVPSGKPAKAVGRREAIGNAIRHVNGSL
jgi:hypothetical protein